MAKIDNSEYEADWWRVVGSLVTVITVGAFLFALLVYWPEI